MINDLRGYELDLYDVSSILRPSANIGERTVILSTGRLRINLYRKRELISVEHFTLPQNWANGSCDES